MNASVMPLRPVESDVNALRMPPHSYEAERALLGAIMMNNRAYERVSDFLKAEHFADPVNARIFSMCVEMFDLGKPVNPVTLKPYLERDDALTAAGGMTYLATIASSAVTIINAKEYGLLIHDLFLRRELIAIGEDTYNGAFEAKPDEPAAMLVERIEEKLFQLGGANGVGPGLRDLKDAVTNAVAVAEMAHKSRGALVGVTTGLRDLDAKLAGLHPTDLLILAGRPSMGKTALATKIARSAAQFFAMTDRPEYRGRQVVVFSLEMSAEQLATRVMAETANIDSHRIRAGQLTDDEFSRFMRAGDELDALPLKIDDTAAASVALIRSRARRAARKKPIGLIVIDYLQLIAPGAKEKPENRVQEVSAITRALKALAKDLNVPVLALSQLSRAVESRDDKRPQLSDLRESGTIEQDSDVVMFVYREEYYLERSEPADHQVAKWNEWKTKLDACQNIAEVIVAKQRHGPIGTVRAYFEASRTAFSDLEQRRSSATTFVAKSEPVDGLGFEKEPPPGHPAAAKGLFDGM